MYELISEKLWDKVPWGEITSCILLAKDQSGSSVLKRIAEGGQLHSLPKNMVNEDLFFSDIAREEKILELSANSGELAILDQRCIEIFSEKNIGKYKKDIVRAIFSATTHNTIGMLPKRLVRDDLFGMITPPNLISPLHNALRLGNINNIPSNFFSVENLFAVQGDGKNIISFIIDKSDEENEPRGKTLLLKLATRIPLNAIDTISSIYPQLRNLLTIEKMRREVQDKTEDSSFLFSEKK